MTTAGKNLKCLNGTALKLIAMALMLCDHLWATIVPGALWLNSLGRLAFPIFAFQVAEGYAHTKNFKRYLLRMFLFALISEIPFNLMSGGGILNPFHQNVMFTFCIALLLMRLLDSVREKHWALRLLTAAACVVLGYLAGFVTFVDYFGYGVVTVLVFRLFRGRRWSWLAQLAALIFINCWLIKGLCFPLTLFGHTFEISQQGLAVLALIPIWLYNGERGPGGKAMQYIGYAFYPVHMLILALLWLYAI